MIGMIIFNKVLTNNLVFNYYNSKIDIQRIEIQNWG